MSVILPDLQDKKDINDDYETGKWNGLHITRMKNNHYVNATKICKEKGKKYNDWIKLESSQELIEDVSTSTDIPIPELSIPIRTGNNNKGREIYLHPQIIYSVITWADPEFKIVEEPEQEAETDPLKEMLDNVRVSSPTNEGHNDPMVDLFEHQGIILQLREISSKIDTLMTVHSETRTEMAKLHQQMVEVKNYMRLKK